MCHSLTTAAKLLYLLPSEDRLPPSSGLRSRSHWRSHPIHFPCSFKHDVPISLSDVAQPFYLLFLITPIISDPITYLDVYNSNINEKYMLYLVIKRWVGGEHKIRNIDDAIRGPTQVVTKDDVLKQNVKSLKLQCLNWTLNVVTEMSVKEINNALMWW